MLYSKHIRNGEELSYHWSLWHLAALMRLAAADREAAALGTEPNPDLNQANDDAAWDAIREHGVFDYTFVLEHQPQTEWIMRPKADDVPDVIAIQPGDRVRIWW